MEKKVTKRCMWQVNTFFFIEFYKRNTRRVIFLCKFYCQRSLDFYKVISYCSKCGKLVALNHYQKCDCFNKQLQLLHIRSLTTLYMFPGILTSDTYSIFSIYLSSEDSHIPSFTDMAIALLNVYFSKSVCPSVFRMILSFTNLVLVL